MRENTGRQTAATFTMRPSFMQKTADTGALLKSEYVWPSAADAQATVDRMIASGYAYTRHEAPGLVVYAFYVAGEMINAIAFEDDDLARVHTALRTGRELTVRYVKEDGTVSRRRTRPQFLARTKGGHLILRAEDDRREGDTRSFRWDRVTHTTLHRRVRRAAPSKSALVAQAAPAPVTGQVIHPRYGLSGTVQDGTRAFTPSGWSVIVTLDEAYKHLAAGGTTRVSESELKAVPAGMVVTQDWNGAPKLITRDAYDRLLAARDPREPKAVDEALSYS